MKEYLYLFMLFACAMTDIVTYRIKNVFLALPLGILLICDPSSQNLRDMLLIFILFIPFYCLGMVKAGDIKLLMAATAFIGTASLIETAVYTVLISVISIMALSIRNKTPVLQTKIPFAFSFFMGSFPFFI